MIDWTWVAYSMAAGLVLALLLTGALFLFVKVLNWMAD